MRAWRRGELRRTLHLLTRSNATPGQRLLAARAAIRLGRPDAAYAMLGEAAVGRHRAIVELVRAEAAEAQGQLQLAAAHARAAGACGALTLARLARLRGDAEEAWSRLRRLDGPDAALEEALLSGDPRPARRALSRARGSDARALACVLVCPDVESRARRARRLDVDPSLRAAVRSLGGEPTAAAELSRLAAVRRREGRRAAFDLYALAVDGGSAASGPRVARDGSWLERDDGARVSLRRRPRVRRTLEALVASPRGIDPEALFDRVWGEPRPPSAVLRNRVDVTLARLRAAGLGEHLERRRGLVLLRGVEVAQRGAS